MRLALFFYGRLACQESRTGQHPMPATGAWAGVFLLQMPSSQGPWFATSQLGGAEF